VSHNPPSPQDEPRGDEPARSQSQWQDQRQSPYEQPPTEPISQGEQYSTEYPPQQSQYPPQQYSPQYSSPYSPQNSPQYAGDQIRFEPAGPQRDHPQGTLAFVLGLLSVLGITILGPFGWYYGRKVVREIDQNPAAYSNRGLAMAGMVLGIIGTVFLILVVLLITFAIIVAIIGASTTTTGT
jgi:hypothetical protein